MNHNLLQTAVAAALGLAMPALAQTDLPRSMLEEVIVTAQKRSQKLTDVPIAISVMSAKMLEDAGARRLSDLSNLAPNVNVSQSSELNSRVTIRGVGAQSRNIGFDTRVGVYLDGVYLGQSPALNQELADLERVEVLRGPQGTLFGKNTVAGAINLITAAPSTDDAFGSASATFGNFDHAQYKGKVNIPLGDRYAVSLSANTMERDGVTKNLYNGEYVGNRDVSNWRAQLLGKISDNFSARLAVDGLDSDQSQLGREALTDILGTAPDVWAPFDLDFGPYDYAYVDYSDQYEQTTQEFQLISPEFERFNYVLGLYYYQQEAFTSRMVEVASEVRDFLPILVPGSSIDSVGTVDTESYALFANGSYDLAPNWQLTLGFRWSVCR